MSQVLVRCPVHGIQSAGGMFGGDASVIFRNVGLSCPVPGCRQTASMLEGEYEFRDSLRLPTLFTPTPAEARRLRNVLIWAQAEAASDRRPAEAIAATIERTLEKDAPAVAGWLSAFKGPVSANAAAWLAVLLAILMWVTSGSDGLTPEDVSRIVEETVKTVQDGGSPAGGPPAIPPAAPDAPATGP
ncbi:hypothetical protein AB0O16_14530 [Microbacterium sp. NPDC089180]|uniref:hypothetical protein n=1 Tax=unclassified Microbacterium TaxID=2609290 RepID=UPI003447B8FF